jgi:hypothetical protein
MKTFKITLLASMLAVALTSYAQEINKTLKPFNKIIASPRVHLVLKEGDHEEVKVVYNNITEDKINIVVKGNTLRIYLDEAKVTEKQRRINGRGGRHSIYNDVSLTAYVTYKKLKHLEIRGSQELTCLDPIVAPKFTLKAYGENQISLASVRTEYFKTSLYGQNRLKIKGGKADYQRYRLFGENKIDASSLKSYAASTHIFGESKLMLSTEDELKVNSFGEAEVTYLGNAQVNRGLMFGRTQIRKQSNSN